MYYQIGIADLRACLEVHRRDGKKIGLVPTMGFLHVGHMELCLACQGAKRRHGGLDSSIRCSSAQRGSARYPRDLERDAALLEKCRRRFSFRARGRISVSTPDADRCRRARHRPAAEGEVRPGILPWATAVTKLFIIVRTCGLFGEKDHQQVVLIKRMVEDLGKPVDVIAVPTAREADGLACPPERLSEREGRGGGHRTANARRGCAALRRVGLR